MAASFALCASRFNEEVTSRLVDGALGTFTRHGIGADRLHTHWVPGAFELPLACRWLAGTGRYAAVIALGAVIRGGTDHYRHICTEAARGLMDVALQTGVPVVFGVLTCETLAQALDRAGGDCGHKGVDAALAAIAMADLHQRVLGTGG